MKKILLLLLSFSARIIICQNGFGTYTTNLPVGTTPQTESCIFVDNANNKWIGFSNPMPGSMAAFAVYTQSTSTWTYWNKTNDPILPSNKVNCIEQDNAGNMWIGTQAGLVKYNGSSFTVYTTTNGLPSNNITSLENINNMLYIGTLSNGLSRYDGTTFTNYNIGNSLFPTNGVTYILAENANNLWMVNGNKLVKFYINSTFTSTSYTLAVSTTTADNFTSIYKDLSGDLWLSNITGPVKYNSSGFTNFNALYPNFTGASGFMGNMCKGPNNGLLNLVNSSNYPTNNFLVELLPGGNFSFYYPASTIKPGRFVSNDISGIAVLAGSVFSNTLGINTGFYTFNGNVYSSISAFGLGPATNTNNFKFLDINRVKAGIMNRGDMHWDIGGSGNTSYEVPIGNNTHSSFASAIWMGGLDASNQLHTAAQMYRQTGNDFWPGPLDTTSAGADTISAVNYDKIWKVSYTDINNFITQFNLGNVPLSYTPTPDMVNWPAHGAGSKAKNLAPFVDVNGDGIYNWQQGDYPKIKGDQTLYFIFNDKLGPHSETGGLPFGVEIHCMAYAYGCPTVLNGRNELAYTTFYDYKIYNRSNSNYHDVYFGYWSDIDLGCYLDDYIGSSPQNNLGFCYNSDNDDATCAGANGYGLYPPAIGNTILKGPKANLNDLIDNDNDGQIDEAGEECLMNIFDFFNNSVGSFTLGSTNPSTQYHYNNYLRGRWKDSTFFTCGGNAYGGTTPTNFVYPWANYNGNPCGTWTESTAGNLAGDRRFVLSSGPFDLPAKGNTEVEYALVWSVDSAASSNNNIASVNKLITDVQKIRTFYNGSISNCLQSVNIGINELDNIQSQIQLYPNPATSFLMVQSVFTLKDSKLSITDITGRTVKTEILSDLHQEKVNISDLNSGIYLLNIIFDNNKTVTKKFVKQ